MKVTEELRHIYRFFRNIYVKLRYYHMKSMPAKTKNVVIMFIDDKHLMRHPGLVDRLKAIISMYYITTTNKRKFKLQFNVPFELEKYLRPNEVDWSVKNDEIDYGMRNVKLITYDVFAELPYLDCSVGQYHCYFYTGHNFLQYKQIDDWKKKWRDMFWELFRPSEYLQELLKYILPEQAYVAVHFRFVNAFGWFEDDFNEILSQADQAMLIDRCLKKIEIIERREKQPVCIFADNAYFIYLVSSKGYMTIGKGENICHISYGSDDLSYDKTFVDFFALSMAEKIYGIHGGGLYNSAFPYYAAIIGDIPYETEYI